MTRTYNKLLERQMRKYLSGVEETPELKRFLRAVSDSYDHGEQDRNLITRSMDISSSELLDKNKELTSKNEILDSFVYRVSHDLKTPANNFISMVKMLKDVLGKEEMSPMVAKILDHLDGAGRAMQVRIQDLLEMTRAEHNIKEAPIVLDLSEEVAKMAAQMETQISQTQAKIETDFSLLPKILLGRENLRSILSNLVGNGIKYRHSERKPTVTILSGSNEEGIWLKVSDNGLGMDLNKDGDRLFKMFARLHDHVEGTGIGLYIVRKIVDYYDGSIHVESSIDHGTTFTIQFGKAAICRQD